jgi:hypothetical protein
MSTMDTTALARIMLGGFGQGAGMVTNAAQIGDARQREAAMQQRYAQEVAYRQQQQQAEQARQLAQMSALANFAEQRGLFTQGPDPMAYGPSQPPMAGPSPVGPFQPGMEPAMPQQPQALGLDRATLMGMDPTTARGVIDDMMRGQREMENARFEAEIEDQIRRQEVSDRAAKARSLRTQLEQAGFPPEQIAKSMAAAGLSEFGAPAGVVNQLFEPAPAPGADWAMGQSLGYPEAMQPAFESGQISPMDAYKNRPDTTAAGGDTDAQIASLVRSIEGPLADPNDESTWAKIDPAGLGFMRLKLETGGQITDAMIDAVLPTRDNRAEIAYLKWFADAKRDEYMKIMGYEDVDPLEAQQAEAAYMHAVRNYRQAAQGDGGSNRAQTGRNPGASREQPDSQSAPTAAPTPAAGESDVAMIARQLAERMFPGVPIQALTTQQHQQIADQLNALNGGR